MKKSSSVSLTLVAGLLGFAATLQAKFLPDNNLHLQDYQESGGGITELEFNEVIDAAVEFYEPLIQRFGANLVVNRLWKNSTVNANAQQIGDQWHVNMYGGLARRPEITKDGFAMVLCHEIGHHLAGYPYVISWASDEGNSDYFASLSCGRELWNNTGDDNEFAAQEIEDLPKKLCDDQFFGEGKARLDLCYRQMLASYSVSNLLATLGESEVSFSETDKTIVAKTYHGHPEGQCRLDTYVAGSLCKADYDSEMIPETEPEMAENSCHSLSGYTKGLRPRCWFKPESEK